MHAYMYGSFCDSEVLNASCRAMDSLNTLSSVFLMEWLLCNMYIHHTWHKAIMFHEAGVVQFALVLTSEGSDGQHITCKVGHSCKT